MRELDRNHTLTSCAIVGAGRLGTALAAALRATGLTSTARSAAAPTRRARRGAAVRAGRARSPPPRRPSRPAPGRPLLGRDGARRARRPRGVLAAPADDRARGRRPRLRAARAPRSPARRRARWRSREELADAARHAPRTVADDDRAAYHAAASIASNFLVTLEGAAERLAATAGVDRELLAPLVRAAVENWAGSAPADALTGPIARGDEATVARQRAAVAERAPDLLPLFDALADADARASRGAPR